MKSILAGGDFTPVNFTPVNLVRVLFSDIIFDRGITRVARKSYPHLKDFYWKMMVKRECFSKAEAEERGGRCIESLIKFSGVPRGTTGRVVAADPVDEGWDVVIEWDLPRRPFGTHHRPLQDWFVKSEYEQYLPEIQ